MSDTKDDGVIITKKRSILGEPDRSSPHYIYYHIYYENKDTKQSVIVSDPSWPEDIEVAIKHLEEALEELSALNSEKINSVLGEKHWLVLYGTANMNWFIDAVAKLVDLFDDAEIGASIFSIFKRHGINYGEEA